MTMNLMARSLPNISYAHRRIERIHFTAAIPLLAIKTYSNTSHNFSAIYSCNMHCDTLNLITASFTYLFNYPIAAKTLNELSRGRNGQLFTGMTINAPSTTR